MADVHYEVDETLKPARDMMDALRSLASAWDRITRLRGTLIQNKDADQSGNAVYAQNASRYGYSGADSAAQQANAAASFAEIDSAFGAGDAAITQILNRHL